MAPQFDLGGELGTIHKKDVGILGSANLSSISIDWLRKGKNGIPFSSAAYQRPRVSGAGGLYLNLGAGVNYWLARRWALRGEFKR